MKKRMPGDNGPCLCGDKTAWHPECYKTSDIKWGKSKDGYVESTDGRFRISPQFEGTTKAQSYRCNDSKTGKSWTADNQRQLKFDVEELMKAEGEPG